MSSATNLRLLDVVIYGLSIGFILFAAWASLR
jgi:hypothetical protein